MKKIIFIVLCFLGIGFAVAAEKRIPHDTMDACELRGWIALDAIKKKNTGMTLKQVKDDFYTWLTEDRMPELSPGPSNMIVSWYNDWGPEDVQDWFKRTYTKTDPQVAYDEEVTDCKKNNGEPPEYKPAPKL